MNAAELLGKSGLFRALDEDAIAKIAATASVRHVQRNDVLFEEGADAEEVFVVRSGRIAMVRQSPDGRESVIALMEPGDVFGEMPLFDEGGRSTAARALETSELLAIPFAPIRLVLRDRPELLWSVVELLVERLRAVDAALADSVFLDVTGRTAKRLLEIAGDSDDFVLPLTQEELAGMVGASRERVNKAIAAFVRLGWIVQEDRRYRITDREQLARRAT